MVSGAHPRDQWVEVTAFGDPFPRFVLAEDGREAEIALARELFALDRITLEVFEDAVGAILAGRPVKLPRPFPPSNPGSASSR